MALKDKVEELFELRARKVTDRYSDKSSPAYIGRSAMVDIIDEKIKVALVAGRSGIVVLDGESYTNPTITMRMFYDTLPQLLKGELSVDDAIAYGYVTLAGSAPMTDWGILRDFFTPELDDRGRVKA